MRIAVMGAGAVGGYFGVKLAAAHDVFLIARGRHLEGMRRTGLAVQSFAGDLRAEPSRCTGDPAQVGQVDLILFCVKSYDTETSARALSPMIGERTLILSLQNGVDNADKLARLWGQEKTLAGVVYLGAQVTLPGVIKHSSGGRVVFGQLDGNATPTTEAIEQAFKAAAIPCEISRNVRRAQWQKLLWNAPFCALSCLTRATVKDIIESASLTQLAVDCMEEVRDAAQAAGLALDGALIEETLRFSKALGDFKPSMLQDLEARKPLEFEAFNGVVVNLQRQAGKKASTNQVFYAALKYLDEKIRTGRLLQ